MGMKTTTSHGESSSRRNDPTATFIRTYLSATNNNGKGRSLKQLENDAKGIDRRRFAAACRNMAYDEYLHTPYWIIISRFMKVINNYTCQICGRTHSMNVHHKTYRCIGYEYLDLEKKLMCVCSSCHEKIHNINRTI